ncbi:ribonuclease P protein component 4 [Methanolapillus ohkumae]|uniref:Ribonuclease P protein component 4 n=1 Tax=Methanolapillus ohkumae TaxID=3028298 RepID=A0AA96ZWG9_9EURY|nr:hypothetical protein MsAm2_15620 [Methanosarcinaceae archaeon Am2]
MSKHNRKKNKDLTKRIAEERILRLFCLADFYQKTRPTHSQRYIALARLISMRYNVRFLREQKRKVCKHCYSHLVVGENCRVRLKNGMILTTCFECGKMSRIPYHSRKSLAKFEKN